MRRFNALLLAAALAAASASAAANPCTQASNHSAFEQVESSTSRGRLGVDVMSLTPELRKHFGAEQDRGVLVARVEPRSPAAQAGLEPGDVLTAVQGRKVADAVDVRAALADVPRGEAVAIELVRDGKPLELSARLMSHAASWVDASWSMDWLRNFFTHLSPPTAATPSTPTRT